MFEWLTGANSTPDYASDFGGPGVAKQGSKFADLFSDDTFIRTLGEMGARVGGKGSVGDILGTGASNLVRNRAVQREGEKVASKSQNIQERLLAGLQDGTLLSPTSDNVAGDRFEIDGDGNWKLIGKKSPDPVGPLQEQQGLESITNTPATQTNNGGSNLRDFSDDQGSKADFSGLDPADVNMILGARQSAGALTQKAITSYLDNKYRNKVFDANTKENQAKLSREEKKLSEEKQQAIIERKQKQEDKIEERKFKIAMKVFEKELAKAEPGSLEEKKALADIANINSQIAEREEKIKNGGMTPAQTAANQIAQKRLEMAMTAVEETKKKDVIEQQRDLVGFEEDILKAINAPETAPLMDHVNAYGNKPYYYTQYNDPGTPYVPFTGGRTGAKLPLITKNGIQMDMASVRASAEKYNMSIEDFLASPGIGILIKGENNDYQPANR